MSIKSLLLNLAIVIYNVGTIWAHEIDIFGSWKYVNSTEFSVLQ
jgi:hypothetical protein